MRQCGLQFGSGSMRWLCHNQTETLPDFHRVIERNIPGLSTGPCPAKIRTNPQAFPAYHQQVFHNLFPEFSTVCPVTSRSSSSVLRVRGGLDCFAEPEIGPRPFL